MAAEASIETPQVNGHSADPSTDKPQTEHATSSAANGDLPNGTSEQQNGDNPEQQQPPENVFKLTIELPHAPGSTQIMVSSQEQVQDIRQSIVDTPDTFQYSCFHLEHKGKRINDFVELSEVEGIVEEPVCKLVEDPYTESQARMHVVRVRELIAAVGDRTDLVTGLDAGTSLCDGVEATITKSADGKDEASPVAGYNINAPGDISTLLAKPREPAPKTVKSLSLSSWNPPPYHLRMRGHLLYLQATTNEGEQFYITSSVTGFYVNKSTNSKFDPLPRSTKPASAHSLISLLGQISPSFNESFRKLQEYNGQRDPLAAYQLSNCTPAAPWMVSSTSIQHHQADIARTQEPFLVAGAENSETLRDWNEEFQSTRELPKETVHERVFRERLTSKLFAEYNEAAVRGACLVARGEVQPLNPTEAKDAQIFVYNNVFYSFGADGVGTFTSDGGDEAARVATGKDVQGVKAVNQLDINGLFTPGTVVVDYLGKRIVGQSIVPGIFKQREPGEYQIDYGGVEGKDVVATLEGFVQPFAELSKSMRVKKHAVWDKENNKHELEASVETKGLLGTDGRKYVLDLYRVTPLDISWIEQHRESEEDSDDTKYPHRMTVLRPELVESYRIVKLREYINQQVEKKRAAKAEMADKEPEQVEAQSKPLDEELLNGDSDSSPEKSAAPSEAGDTKPNGELTNGNAEPKKEESEKETVDVSDFKFSLNPDVFSGQQPQTDAEKAEWEADEGEVRAVCTYLTREVIPKMVRDMREGDTAFPMDGQSLIREMHKRGINVRYLGEIVRHCEENQKDNRVTALSWLCIHEMVSRVFKHMVNQQLKQLPPVFAQSCVSHLLNCLLGKEMNAKPVAVVDEDFKDLYPDVELEFPKLTPEGLSEEIRRQIRLRYRVPITGDLVHRGKELQMLREVCLKLGLQLEAKEYQFTKMANQLNEKNSQESLEVPKTNGVHPPAEGGKKKKGKKNVEQSPNRAASPTTPPTTFVPENVFNIVPMVKEASPRSVLAEEALDAGRMSIQQEQKEIGQELLLESLSLHEQIYGILHPEVARVYYALSTLYYTLDEKNAAVELAKKAVIVSERTLGVDNAETLLAYLNLSLFEHATGNTRTALGYVCHAMDLWKVVYGPNHPDSITTINNAAVMLQTMKRYRESRQWFETSLALCEDMTGKQTVATGTLLFQLAQALALDGDSKSAVTKMNESYRIFNAELGPENQNTKEAESWLHTLTTSAVSQAKQANALLQNRRLLARSGRTPRVAMGARPQPPAEKAAVPAADAAPKIDNKSVDEWYRYITGGDNAGKQATPKKKKTAHPKRR